jgi:hypothetical protein
MPRFQDQIGQDLVAENPATAGSLIWKLRAGRGLGNVFTERNVPVQHVLLVNAIQWRL